MKIERLVFFADDIELIIGLTGELRINAGPRLPYERVIKIEEHKAPDHSYFIIEFEGDWRWAIYLETDKATELRDWLTRHKIKIEA